MTDATQQQQQQEAGGTIVKHREFMCDGDDHEVLSQKLQVVNDELEVGNCFALSATEKNFHIKKNQV